MRTLIILMLLMIPGVLLADEWRLETLDSSPIMGNYNAIAMDAQGYRHIVTLDHIYSTLKYMHEDASGWKVETITELQQYAKDVSIALDSSGYPHVSYFAQTEERLRYAWKTAAGWSQIPVIAADDVCTTI